MDARYAHIIQAFYFVAQEFASYGGFLGNGQVGGAGGDDRNPVLGALCSVFRALCRNDPGGFIKFSFR